MYYIATILYGYSIWYDIIYYISHHIWNSANAKKSKYCAHAYLFAFDCFRVSKISSAFTWAPENWMRNVGFGVLRLNENDNQPLTTSNSVPVFHPPPSPGATIDIGAVAAGVPINTPPALVLENKAHPGPLEFIVLTEADEQGELGVRYSLLLAFLCLRCALFDPPPPAPRVYLSRDVLTHSVVESAFGVAPDSKLPVFIHVVPPVC